MTNTITSVIYVYLLTQKKKKKGCWWISGHDDDAHTSSRLSLFDSQATRRGTTPPMFRKNTLLSYSVLIMGVLDPHETFSAAKRP
jgi:hypothetical protein